MLKATFTEYQAAKNEILFGNEFKEYSSLENGIIHKEYCTENGQNFYEVNNNGRIEFWSTKNSESRIYNENSEVKELHAETFQTLDQWNCGNGQSFRELLLRKAVEQTKFYATDILYTLEKIPGLMASCESFCLFITFSDTHIEDFLDLDKFENRKGLIRDCNTVYALTWNRDNDYKDSNWNRLRLLDVTEITLPQIKDNKFPVFAE